MLRIFCQLVISISVICKSLQFLVLPLLHAHFRPTYLIKYTPTQKMYEVGLSKDKLQEWTGHSTLISENLKIVEISKNNFDTL